MAHSAGHNAVIASALALTFLGILGGFAYGRQRFNVSTTIQVQMFYGFNNTTGALTNGFACLCQKISGNATTWNGDGDALCNDGNPDKAIKLDNAFWIPVNLQVTKPLPTGACCKQQPKIRKGNLPGVNPGSSCWLSG